MYVLFDHRSYTSISIAHKAFTGICLVDKIARQVNIYIIIHYNKIYNLITIFYRVQCIKFNEGWYRSLTPSAKIVDGKMVVLDMCVYYNTPMTGFNKNNDLKWCAYISRGFHFIIKISRIFSTFLDFSIDRKEKLQTI